MNKQSRGKLFLISGASGVGKTSLTNGVLESCGKKLHLRRVITYTTRQPGKQETSGKDYFFVSPIEFAQKEAEGFFIETSERYGNRYGSPASVLNDLVQGVSYIMVLDHTGVESLLTRVPHAVAIWISMPDSKELERRLLDRERESKEKIALRVVLAHEEELVARESGCYAFFVKNDNFSRALQELEQILCKSLHRKVVD